MPPSGGLEDSLFNFMNEYKSSNVPFATEDRQWDCRFNVQLESDLEALLTSIKQSWESGKLKYILVGGVEIGTRQYQDDYNIQHVHVAAMFINRISKRSLLTTWNIKQGNGYYMVPRNRNLPYSGWKNHHAKEFSKVDPTKCILYEMGQLPKDHAIQGEAFVKRSDDEKKRKIDEVLIDMRHMIENGEDEQAWKKYPRTYLQYGEKVKSMLLQKS
nr:nonstructural protein [Flumine parvovirus 13]